MLNKLSKLSDYFLERIIWLCSPHLKRFIVRNLKNFVNKVEMASYSSLIIKTQTKQALLAIEKDDYITAKKKLLDVAKLNPLNYLTMLHLGKVNFLLLRSSDDQTNVDTNKMLKIIASMNKEIESDSIYVPGEFWSSVGNWHIDLLKKYGVENFKRTVSHHYQNWLMCNLDELQVRELYKLWSLHSSVQPWLNVMEAPNNVGFYTTEDGVYPLSIPENRENYRVAVGLLWEYVKNSDHFNVLDKLSESEIGNPVRIWREGKLISSDIAHSVRERNMFLQNISLNGDESLVVGELGAGHGRLAEVFGQTTNFRYIIFDITPALFVSQYYIKNLFPNEKIFEFRHFDDFFEINDELKECRFAFFTTNQIEKFPDNYFNLFVNMNSLAEMRLEQINNFIYHIDRLTSGWFMSRQQLNSTNPIENVVLSKDNYRMPIGWKLTLDKNDDIYPTYFNQIWKK